MRLTKPLSRIFIAAMAYVMVFTLFAGPSIDAKVIELGKDSTEFSQGNKLVLHKDPDIKSWKIKTNVPSSRLIDRTDTTGLSASKQKQFKKYHNFQQNYDHVWYEIKNLKRSDTITVDYGNAGTYEGRAVDLTVEYTNMKYEQNINGTNADGSPKGNANWTKGSGFFQISESPYSGFVYYNIAHGTVKYTFKDAVTGQKVELNENSFMTFNSLNGYNSPNFDKLYGSLPGTVAEFFAYNTHPSYVDSHELGVYLSDTTDMKYGSYSNISDGNTIFHGYSNDFHDKLGSETFTNNSVSFQVEGTTQEFTFGSANRNSAWQAPSTAVLFDVSAPKPDLNVFSLGNCEMTGGVATVGDKFMYELDQKVHVLGQDILERYNTVALEVNVPAGVRVLDMRVLDGDGNEVPSKYLSELKQHTSGALNGVVRAKFSTSYLKGVFDADDEQIAGMDYNGENYKLQVDVIIDDSRNVDNKIVKAMGRSTFNNQAKVADPVTNTVVEPN